MMRALAVVCLLCGIAAADATDDLAAFGKRWPDAAITLTQSQVQALLVHATPCARFDVTNARSPIASATSSLSPDGRSLAFVTDLDVDASGAKVLGTTADLGLVLVVIDAAGAIWGRSLTAFRICSANGFSFQWSTDAHRVLVMTDSGHGLRVALADIAGHSILFQGFTNDTPLASPDLRHVAWLPWNSGFPFVDEKGDPRPLDGDQLHVDDLDVWGSILPDAAKVWDIHWTSESTLTFCGSKPKLPAARYAATVAPKLRVARINGDCP